MARIKFQTKARTLASIAPLITSAKVLPIEFFSASDWQRNPNRIIDHLLKCFSSQSLIVRSSAWNEDGVNTSLAGKYISVLNVTGSNGLIRAIDTVVDSYSKDSNPHAMDEVLVQPMLSNVHMSGVAFGLDPNSGAPYRVINYAYGNDTTSVTSGNGLITHTYIHAITTNIPPPEILQPILALIEELEDIFGDDALDIEFAIVGESLILLQVRKLILKEGSYSRDEHVRLLSEVANKIKQARQPHPFLYGKKSVFGVMPDWNPAEIIGVRPRPLALSLYRELVTDAIWAYQRHNYGYKNLRSFPLMLHFHGLPYIDVRVSFNSFVPQHIETDIAHRLVDYYIDRLLKFPSLHDKVEFEIVFSCYTFDLGHRISDLAEYGFTGDEITHLSEALRHLTNRIIEPKNGLWRSDRDKLEVLAARRQLVLESDLELESRIYWLLEDCKRYGTLPFAGLARAGFIAVQILRSLVSVGVFSQEDYDAFFCGLNTISSQISRDTKQLKQKDFLSKYGHLRPGTYDILSPRYDEDPERYFIWGNNNVTEAVTEKSKQFSLTLAQARDIRRLLHEHGLLADVVELFDFLQAGIELREYSKFEFTRNLSDALSLIKEFGALHGFTADDMSYASVGVFNELYAGSTNPKFLLEKTIEGGKRRYSESCRIWLPPLISHENDVWGFHIPTSEPNFVTQKTIMAPVVTLTDRWALDGAIVAIPSADPGFDWLFSHNIAGLITAYGGINSHMAIRAGELGLPAVIGAGESSFQRWLLAKKLLVNCAARRVEIIS